MDDGANDRAGERVGLIVLDLDGTVLSPMGHVTPRTRAAIRAAVDADIGVCIATGRSWWESRSVIAEAELTGPGVFAGGAIVNQMETGASLSDATMHPDVARQVCQVIDREGLAAMVLQDRNREPFEWLIAAEHPMPPTVPEWLAAHGSSNARVDGLTAASHAGTVRISTVDLVEVNARVGRALREELGDSIYLHEITVPTLGISVLEVFDATVNKWSGVQRAAQLRGVDERAIIAIGDDMNDLPMLRGAAVGVAMGNAREEVKQVANLAIASNAAEGLARYLEQIVTAGGTLAAAHEWDEG
jgi:hypothetical protein